MRFNANSRVLDWAFVRYRIGDMFRCVGIGEAEGNIRLPRFEYVDRRPDVIDIAGFTRITERETELVIKDSGLPVLNWNLCTSSDLFIIQYISTGNPLLLYVLIQYSIFTIWEYLQHMNLFSVPSITYFTRLQIFPTILLPHYFYSLLSHMKIRVNLSQLNILFGN